MRVSQAQLNSLKSRQSASDTRKFSGSVCEAPGIPSRFPGVFLNSKQAGTPLSRVVSPGYPYLLVPRPRRHPLTGTPPGLFFKRSIHSGHMALKK